MMLGKFRIGEEVRVDIPSGERVGEGMMRENGHEFVISNRNSYCYILGGSGYEWPEEYLRLVRSIEELPLARYYYFQFRATAHEGYGEYGMARVVSTVMSGYEYSHGWKGKWKPEMDKTVGKIYEIMGFNRDTYSVKLSSGYEYPAFTLSKFYGNFNIEGEDGNEFRAEVDREKGIFSYGDVDIPLSVIQDVIKYCEK